MITYEQLKIAVLSLYSMDQLAESAQDAFEQQMETQFPDIQSKPEHEQAAAAIYVLLQQIPQELAVDSVAEIAKWIAKAKPAPTARDLDIQLGVHFEEVAEHLDTLQGADEYTNLALSEVKAHTVYLATGLKSGKLSVLIRDREEYLDACADQIVTATGSAVLAGMQIAKAVQIVNASNWSKFKDGEPIFDANGKIAKNPETYVKADLRGLA